MTDYPLQQTGSEQNSEADVMRYTIERILSRISTATIASVQSVTTSGQVAAVGMVDVQPLVNMIDGVGTNYKHGTVHNIPYFRLQGGSSAIILDPKAGDLGILVFSDRDISSVKKNKKQSPPGSFRRWEMADGLFFPCVLGGAPTSYVQFQDDGTMVLSPDNGTTTVTVKAKKIQAKINGRLLTMNDQKTYLNCDVGQETDRIVCESGPLDDVWAKFPKGPT